MYAVMCIHDVCIVRFYVFIHVSMPIYMYVFMPMLCCVFKTVYRLLYVFQRHIDFKSNLQNILSISVPFVSVKRVGRVISGLKLYDIKRSKKSQKYYSEFSCIFSRLILVSPTNAMLWFCDIMVSIMGVNSTINCLRI